MSLFDDTPLHHNHRLVGLLPSYTLGPIVNKPSNMMHSRYKALLLLLTGLFGTAIAVIPPGAYPGSVHDSYNNNNNNKHNHKNTSNSPKKSWSSMLTVDPTKILSHLIQRGGLVLPKDAAKHWEVARQVLSVQAAELNVVSKELILYNFTIGLDQNTPALRIGRAGVTWDSYLRPTLDIVVDDVDVLIEFTNVMLTENNWNEIQDMGFPPDISVDHKSRNSKAVSDDENSFIRFHKIHLKGTFTVRITSRPLDGKEIGTMTLNLKELQSLSKEIQRSSDRNLQLTGRAGCSPRELSEIVQHFLDQKVRAFVKARVSELATDPKAAIQKSGDLIHRASDNVLDYVKKAGRLKEHDLEQAATKRLESWGVPDPSAAFNSLKERTLYAVGRLNVTAVRDQVNKEAAATMESLQEMRESLKNPDKRDDETDFVFADW
jgi:hypothetical protein